LRHRSLPSFIGRIAKSRRPTLGKSSTTVYEAGRTKVKFEFEIVISSMARAKYNIDTPERIIEAATELFARHGHRAVKLKDVAQAADVNGAAVNYHFGDKAKLYRAVIEHCLNHREAAAPIYEERWQALSPQQRLLKFIAALMEQLLHERSTTLMSRIMLWEAIDPTTEFDRLVAKLPGRQLKILDRIVCDWLGPDASERTIRAASISILGQCVYYRYGRSILEKVERRKRTSETEINSIVGEIFEFSAEALHGIAARCSSGQTAPARLPNSKMANLGRNREAS
jgi:TetR/AcrR family transcriptional regulator, regulator of cefoperazone and chloramphenicol sensitivity